MGSAWRQAIDAAPAGHLNYRPPRIPRTWSWSSPLLETALPPSGRGTPARLLKRPPASSTITWTAATSHSETSGSAATSTAPSATIMCVQKSPKPRPRQQRRSSSRKRSVRPCCVHEETLEWPSCASSRCATFETRSGTPSAKAPAPLAADQRAAVALQGDQRGEHRDAADVVLGAVDRVDDPARGCLGAVAPGDAELLAKDRVVGPLLADALAQQLLGGPVRLGDRGQVRLGLDHQIGGAEAFQGDGVGKVGELQRQPEVDEIRVVCVVISDGRVHAGQPTSP